MITIKNEAQIDGMRKAGALLYEVLETVCEAVKPGVSTGYLNELADHMIRKAGAVPSFYHYEGFPASLCTSVDDCVIHGIPSDKEILKEGSLLKLDCGLILDGWQADSARTVGVGQISEENQRLLDTTKAAFFAGAAKAIAGNRLGDLGRAVQEVAEAAGFTVVRDYSGHGIGREMHEDPAVYNFGIPGHGLKLRKGMAIAIEPMVCAGDWHVQARPDGWFVCTRDHSMTAHYEHTVAILEGQKPEILTYPGYQWKEDA
jgi:methionyl aminopeptidase